MKHWIDRAHLFDFFFSALNMSDQTVALRLGFAIVLIGAIFVFLMWIDIVAETKLSGLTLSQFIQARESCRVR